MADAGHRGSGGRAPVRPGVRAWLDSIPLTARMIFYAIFFLTGVLVGLPYLAYQIDVHLPACRVDIGVFRYVGVAVFVLFFVIYARGSYTLTRLGRGAYVEFDPPKEFVATGPFCWCRNPIAGSVVGMILGEALAFSSVGIFLLFLVAIPLAHLQVVLLEEPLLERRFGSAYNDYRARVPRWFPRPPGNEGAR
ncbi:MAG TPA: isoprenylcysteine carboxylmethyltransferase family protein [Phycisphaerae bacterium]|nr:isoprenylcysteine carboxylmethyltransferase family protein [Phycisphaerae bacterium]